MEKGVDYIVENLKEYIVNSYQHVKYNLAIKIGCAALLILFGAGLLGCSYDAGKANVQQRKLKKTIRIETENAEEVEGMEATAVYKGKRLKLNKTQRNIDEVDYELPDEILQDTEQEKTVEVVLADSEGFSDTLELKVTSDSGIVSCKTIPGKLE